MNCRQLLEAIQIKLRAATWPSGSAGAIFHPGSVVVTPGTSPDRILARRGGVPLALIHAGSAQVDPEAGENQNLLRQELTVTLVVANNSDGFGEASMLGGPKSGGVGESDGRGILELEVELFRTMKLLDADDGVNIVLEATGAADFIEDESSNGVTYRDYQFRADITAIES